MRRTIAPALAAAAIAVFALAGCASGGSPAGYSAGSSHSASAPPSTAQAGNAATSNDLSTASTALGTVVVDGKGLTVYVFDNDTAGSGKSSCTGACLGLWPPVTTGSASPSASGVTGKLGTIVAANGKHQVTLNGSPLYTYSGDRAKGDVTGQGVQGIWWAVSPSGDKITGSSKSSGY
ncbi:hypothetical protein GCM10028798_00990 [Humibacter antri]